MGPACIGFSMADTTKLSTTVPDETVEWLRAAYPDATSDSMRLVMCISDARKLHALMEARRVTEIAIDDA